MSIDYSDIIARKLVFVQEILKIYDFVVNLHIYKHKGIVNIRLSKLTTSNVKIIIWAVCSDFVHSGERKTFL